MYFLFLAYTPLDATPRPQSRRVATSCIGAAFALYNDTVAARMATLSWYKENRIVGATAPRCAGKFSYYILFFIYIICIYFFPFLSYCTFRVTEKNEKNKNTASEKLCFRFPTQRNFIFTQTKIILVIQYILYIHNIISL